MGGLLKECGQKSGRRKWVASSRKQQGHKLGAVVVRHWQQRRVTRGLTLQWHIKPECVEGRCTHAAAIAQPACLREWGRPDTARGGLGCFACSVTAHAGTYTRAFIPAEAVAASVNLIARRWLCYPCISPAACVQCPAPPCAFQLPVYFILLHVCVCVCVCVCALSSAKAVVLAQQHSCSGVDRERRSIPHRTTSCF